MAAEIMHAGAGKGDVRYASMRPRRMAAEISCLWIDDYRGIRGLQ